MNEYEKEKYNYSDLIPKFGQIFEKQAILMEKWNDQLKEIYFRAGKCTVYEFAEYYKTNSANKLLPN